MSAEGAERNSTAEFVRFLHIAKGSASELGTQVYIAQQAEFISKEIQQSLTEELKAISSMLHSLIKSLNNKHPKTRQLDLELKT